MKTTKSRDGTTLAFDVFGNGPILIYITGASCFRSFTPVLKHARALAERFTVVNYDRRGRGDSGNSLPYAIEREVEDIEALIDLTGGKASIYGHSSGAVLALEAGLRLRGKVEKIVLYDAAYVHNETERLSYGRLAERVLQLLGQGRHARAMRTFLAGIGMPKLFVWLMPMMPGWGAMVRLAPTLAYDIELTKGLAPLDRAAHLAVPALIVFGERSPAGMADVASQLAGAIPRASLQRLAGQDHMVDAKALLPLLADFLSPASSSPAEPVTLPG
jgi:pimeloyl-ACP methyl ester carboxylesterase